MRYLLPGLLALFLVLPAASAFAGPGPDWRPAPQKYTRHYRPAPPVTRHWAPAPRSSYRYAPAPPPSRWYRHYRPTVKAHPYTGKRYYYTPWSRW